MVGGGITGLAAALRLRDIDPQAKITLLESSDRLGGVLQTVRQDGFLIERGADNFITNLPWAVELCRRLGLADDLLATNEQLRQAYVVRQGRLHRIPAGFLLMVPQRIWPLLLSGLLSPWGKLRVLGEYFIPPRRAGGDESLASFARRRLGREAFERLVQPLVGGIYTADPEQLSLAATLPRFLEMERKHGGLLRGRGHARQPAETAEGDAGSSGARYSLFLAPREGLSSLVRACAEQLAPDSIRLASRATSLVRRTAGGWRVGLSAPGQPDESIECDAVILALPAPAAAKLVAGASPELATALGRIAYAGVAVVSTGYRRDQVGHPLEGFGFVVPTKERRSILAASFSSVKFAGRAPQEHVLIRSFLGGACQAELAELADQPLGELVRRELGELIGARGMPVVCDIARWPASMPQYHLGHIELVESIQRLAAGLPDLALAGNAYHGVGIAQCIHSGQAAAERVLLDAPTADRHAT